MCLGSGGTNNGGTGGSNDVSSGLYLDFSIHSTCDLDRFISLMKAPSSITCNENNKSNI